MHKEWINDFVSYHNYVSNLDNFNKEGLSLDRIDNDGNYEPDNLRWADRITQGNNKRRVIRLDVSGETLTFRDMSIRYGVKFKTLKNRYRRGDRGMRLVRPLRKVN